MERLENDILSMKKHIESLAGTPTTEQLTAKVTTLADAIIRDSSSLPIRIKEIVNEAFTVILGWNLKNKIITSKTLFNVQNLIITLDQIYNEITNWSPPIIPTEEELSSLSVACNKLWDLDSSRLVPEIDYKINLQNGKSLYNNNDVASLPLFSYVNENILQKPTFKSFIALLDNYSAEIGQVEVVTSEEITENYKFLNLIMDTGLMQYIYQYLLIHKKTHAKDRTAFIKELYGLWFGLYSRSHQGNDSSGFEHVFLGEIKNNEITGFHNWIRIYLEEKLHNFNYLGFIKPKKRNIELPDEGSQLISIQFEWNSARKLVSSSMIGTSPEFEIALYTLCFYMGQSNENIVQLGPYETLITCYKWPANPRLKDKVYIATSFPSEIV